MSVHIRANLAPLAGALALLAATAVFMSASGPASANSGICGRTQQIQTAILSKLNNVSACEDVTSDHLSGITDELIFDSMDIGSLKSGDFAGLSNLQELDLEHNTISTLPDGVFDDLASLKMLWLGVNDLESLPDGVFDNLSNLEKLDLYFNDLASLPDGVFDNLSNLKWLFLEENQMDDLPDGVFDNLSNLETLDLYGNEFSDLPSGVFDGLVNLETLDLAYNGLSEIQSSIFDNQSKLEWLILYGNSLDDLPDGVFANLSNLEVLVLTDNELESLPDGVFDEMYGLEELYLTDNPSAPFMFTAELERQGDDTLVVRMAPPVPFDTKVTLSAQGGTLSNNEVTVAARSAASEAVRVTPDGNGAVIVTVESAVLQARFQPYRLGLQIRSGVRYNGVTTALGPPITLSAAQSNMPATGAPTIGGTVQVGETLTVDTSGITDADGLDNVSYSYQWLSSRDTEIQGATGSTYTLVADNEAKTIKVRVSFTDDGGNDETLTSTPTDAVAGPLPDPLTASLENIPENHDGESPFAFELRFSGECQLSYMTLKLHAFTVEEGTVKNAQRQDKPSNILWRITVEPDSGADVTVTLPVTTDCNATGAICTEDGRRLSNRVELTVSGPQSSGQNSPATGAPTISGTVQVGETLTVDTSGITDADGLDNVSYSYQWLSSRDTEIQGATGSTYTLVADNEAKTIKVRVSFTDDGGNDETLTSMPTDAVAGPDPLTASLENIPENHDGESPFAFELRFSEEYQLSYETLKLHAFTVEEGTVKNAQRQDRSSNILWRITVEPDSGADVTVTLPVTTDCNATGAICTEDGRRLSNRVELTVTGPQSSGQNSPATGAPTISGTVQVGETLTVDTSGITDADGLDNVSYSYQWLSSRDTEIQGATGSTYTLVADNEAKTIKVRVSFTDDGGNDETLTSMPTDEVDPASIMEEEHGPIWSATLTAGMMTSGYGTSAFSDDGELSPTSLDLDGVTYTVNMIEAASWMYIGVDKKLPIDFRLEVDGQQLDSADASFTSYSYSNVYMWEEAQMTWAGGDTIDLALYRADGNSD